MMTSAPPKMQQAISGGKLMKDAQKAYTKQDDSEMQDKVFIPENIEESDSESDSFGERLRKLNEDGQSSMQDGQIEHLWFVNVEPNGNEKLADTPQELCTMRNLINATSQRCLQEGKSLSLLRFSFLMTISFRLRSVKTWVVMFRWKRCLHKVKSKLL